MLWAIQEQKAGLKLITSLPPDKDSLLHDNS
jgi:hypothetical protein